MKSAPAMPSRDNLAKESIMLVEGEKLKEQLNGDIDEMVRSIYMLLAHAKLPNKMTVHPEGHGYISRELRFKLDGRWYFSAVLNQSWILWYFRRPALSAQAKEPEELIRIFPEAQITGQSEVKLRIKELAAAYTVLRWVTQNC